MKSLVSVNTEVGKILTSSRVVTRVGSFIAVDPFSLTVPTPWLGASYIVGEFTFTTSRSTIITMLSGKPITPQFCLALRCINDDLTVDRYKLWQDVGELLHVPLYAKQPLKKTFTVEVWTVEDQPSINLSAVITLTLGLKYLPYNCSDVSAREEDEAVINTAIWSRLADGLPLLFNADFSQDAPTVLITESGETIITESGSEIIIY